MKSLNLLLCGAAMLATVACSSSKPNSSASTNNANRARAYEAYDELDANVGNPRTNRNATPAQASQQTSNQSAAASNASYSAAPAESNQDVTIAKNNSGIPAANMANMPKPVIMVMPAPSATGASIQEVIRMNPNSRAAMEGVLESLTKKGYEVKSLEGSEDLNNVVQMQNDIAGTEEDLAYIASLSLNADIYIKFSGFLNDLGEVVVELSAYETSTARQLASQSSIVKNHGDNTPANMRANLKTAAKKAMMGVEPKMLNYWAEDMKNGVQYKVVMNIKGDYSGSQLEDLQEDSVDKLKSVFNKVKVNSMTAQTMDMVIYANPDKYEDAQAVYSAIRKNLKGTAETTKINVVHKLIVLDIN